MFWIIPSIVESWFIFNAMGNVLSACFTENYAGCLPILPFVPFHVFYPHPETRIRASKGYRPWRGISRGGIPYREGASDTLQGGIRWGEGVSNAMPSNALQRGISQPSSEGCHHPKIFWFLGYHGLIPSRIRHTPDYMKWIPYRMGIRYPLHTVSFSDTFEHRMPYH